MRPSTDNLKKAESETSQSFHLVQHTSAAAPAGSVLLLLLPSPCAEGRLDPTDTPSGLVPLLYKTGILARSW